MPRGSPASGWWISPASSRAGHEPQWPDLQLCGRLSPLASAASSSAWRGATRSVRPCGSMRAWCSCGLGGYVRDESHQVASSRASRLDASGGEGHGGVVFVNPGAEEIARLLRGAHTIAVVGLSGDPTRPSHGVTRALQRFGYRIIPVNPTVESVLGEPAVASLEQLSEELGRDERVDIVDVFRRPQHVAGIVPA